MVGAIVALSCKATLNARSSSKSDNFIPRRRASLLISSVAIRCHKILSLRSTMVPATLSSVDQSVVWKNRGRSCVESFLVNTE